MLEWIYLFAAVVGCTILVCQLALALFGLGHDSLDMGHHVGGDFQADAHLGDSFHGAHSGDAHTADAHSDSTHLFAVVSFKTLVAAASFFGVTGLSTLKAGFPATTTVVLALAAGAFAMYGMYWLLRLVAGLGSAGNEQIDNAVGLAATVYVPIPAAGKGAGKVQLSMQNRIVEYQAVSADAEPLKTGESVEVVGIRDGDTVEVRRAAKPLEKQPAAC